MTKLDEIFEGFNGVIGASYDKEPYNQDELKQAIIELIDQHVQEVIGDDYKHLPGLVTSQDCTEDDCDCLADVINGVKAGQRNRHKKLVGRLDEE